MDFELVPTKSLGPFYIGMPIREAIAEIIKTKGKIEKVDLVYSDDAPLSEHIILNLTNQAIQLKFEATSQRLQIIEVNLHNYAQSSASIIYKGRGKPLILSHPEEEPCFETVYKVLGSTTPGSWNSETKLYTLNYDGWGLTFEFSVPPKYHEAYAKLKPGDLPPTNAAATKLSIYNGSPGHYKLPELAGELGKKYMIPVRVVINEGIKIGEHYIRFGDTPQDVVSAIGAPSDLYYKIDDFRAGKPSRSGYFLNYYDLGLDLLIDISTNTVIKIIFHTNFPCHMSFNQYAKCNFHYPLASDAGKELNADSKWDDVKDFFILDKEGKKTEEPKPIVGKQTGRFGPTLFYSYNGIVVEVMKANGHLASVCLFKTIPTEP